MDLIWHELTMNSVYLITNISKDKKENKNTVEIELIIIG